MRQKPPYYPATYAGHKLNSPLSINPGHVLTPSLQPLHGCLYSTLGGSAVGNAHLSFKLVRIATGVMQTAAYSSWTVQTWWKSCICVWWLWTPPTETYSSMFLWLLNCTPLRLKLVQLYSIIFIYFFKDSVSASSKGWMLNMFSRYLIPYDMISEQDQPLQTSYKYLHFHSYSTAWLQLSVVIQSMV